MKLESFFKNLFFFSLFLMVTCAPSAANGANCTVSDGSTSQITQVLVRDLNLSSLSLTSMIDAVPDLPQSHVEREIENGKNLCAATSASNGVVWLATHGLSGLMDGIDGSDDARKQINLALTLAGPDFMNTDLDEGTGPKGFMKGLDKYLTAHTAGHYQISYQGWRTPDSPFSDGHEIPELGFLDSLSNGIAWLNVGWYKFDADTCTFERHNGHWVTVVGYDFSDSSNPQLIIHDPSPRSGAAFQNERIAFNVLPTGNLTGPNPGLPRRADNLLQLDGDLKIPNDRLAILDSVVILRIM